MANEFKIRKGYKSLASSEITGSLNISTDLTVDGSIYGDLIGTSSYSNTSSYVEYESIASKPTLVSSSVQLAADISGSVTTVSESLASRIDVFEDATVISSSIQIAADISGSSTLLSESLASRIDSNDSEISVLQTFSQSVDTALSFDNTDVTVAGDIVVLGTGSFNYLQSVEGGIKKVGDAYIILNADTPTARYSGIRVYDSGSAQETGSLEYDSVSNHWFYESANEGYAAILMSGPKGTRGALSVPTSGSIPVIAGNHMYTSDISNLNDIVSINAATEVSSSLKVTGNVGIGTDTPTFPLHVIGTTSNVALFERTGGAWAKVQIKAGSDTGNSYIEFLDQTGVAGSLNYEHANDSLIFNVSSSTALTLTHNGILQLDGYGNGAYLSSIGSFRIDIDSDNNQTDRAFIISKDATGTELMRVQEDGNVGIGTTSPLSTLHIQPEYTGSYTGQFSGVYSYQPTVSEVVIKTQLGASASTNDFNGIRFLVDGNTSGIASAGIYAVREANEGNGSTTLTFATRAGTGATAERVRINSNGSVGIGTNAPKETLSLYEADYPAIHFTNSSTGVTSTDGITVLLDGSTKDLIVRQREAAHIRWYSNNTEKMRLQSDGNVGIGTTSPSDLLHIAGVGQDATLRVRSNDNDAILTLQSDNASQSIIYMGDENNRAVGRLLYDQTTNSMQLYTSNNERMRIDSLGKVGIGTDSPSFKLDVLAANNEQFRIDSSDTNDTTFFIDYNQTGASNRIRLRNAAGDFAINVNNTTEAMRIDSSGNVGIGTTGPTNSLEVAGNIAVKTTSGNSGVKVITDSAAEGFLIFGDADDNSMGGMAYNNSTNTLSIDANNQERITILSDGNVGIGTTAPNASLHVPGVIRSNDEIVVSKAPSDTVGAGPNFYLDGGTGSSYTQLSQGVGRFTIWGYSSGWAEKMTIRHSDGNVGIGTTSPANKLHVVGNSFIDATSASAALTLGRYTGQPTIKAGTDDGGYLIMDSSGGMLGLNWYTSDQVILANGGGNVGIGTTSTSYKLDVNGTARVQSNAQVNGDLTVLGSTNGIYVDSSGHASVRIDRGSTSFDNNLLFYTAGALDFRLWQDGSSDYLYVKDETGGGGNMVTFQKGGNVGIGTTTPASRLEVYASGSTVLDIQGSLGQLFSVDDDLTGTLFAVSDISGVPILSVEDTGVVEIDGSLGIGTATPNGNLQFSNAAETRKIVLYEGANNDYQFYGFGVEASTLVYSVYTTGDDHVFFAGTGTSTRSELMRIGGNGNVGIGTSSPGGKLAVEGVGLAANPTLDIVNTSNSAFVHSIEAISPNLSANRTNMILVGQASSTKNSGYIGYYWTAAGSNNNFVSIGHWGADHILRIYGDGSVRATGDITAYYSSDERLKENKKPIENASDKLKQISGYKFDWIPKDGIHRNEGHDIGVIAQEVEKVLPEVVTTRENGYKAVKYEKLVALLIQSNKELIARVEELEAKIK